MEYETEEQQVEALKEWWAENGKAVIAGIVLGAGVIGGWTFWKGHQEKQAVIASDTFSQTMEAVSSGDSTRALSLADELKDDQPDTLYSEGRATLEDDIDLHQLIPEGTGLNEVLYAIEKKMLTQALIDTDHVQARAADKLGITKSLLQYKMKKYRIKKKK